MQIRKRIAALPIVERLKAAPVLSTTPRTTMATITWAGTAGRITGIAAKGLLWAHRTINWAEVAQIVLQGLQILIVLTLLAGRATRSAWDALLEQSERLSRGYARLLLGPAPEPIVIITGPARPVPQPTGPIRAELEAMTCRQLMALTGTRRKLAKRQLLELALAA